MKTLVVYYSLDGNSAFVAEQIRAALDADILRLETADSKKRTGFSKMFWGGRMVMTRAMPELKPYTADPGAYDLVILGGPVWAGSFAPPLKTFLAQTPVKGRRVALFVCHGGGKGAALEKMKAELSGNTFAGEFDMKSPLSQDSADAAGRIAGWAKSLG